MASSFLLILKHMAKDFNEKALVDLSMDKLKSFGLERKQSRGEFIWTIALDEEYSLVIMEGGIAIADTSQVNSNIDDEGEAPVMEVV